MNMGLTAEERAAQIQDFARRRRRVLLCAATRTRCAAQAEGRFEDEIVPVKIETPAERPAKPKHTETIFDKDEGPRADTSLEALAKLKPVFHASGTVTAGNSSQTSDGAAAALVMSDSKARELGLKPKARFVSFAAAACRRRSWESARSWRFPKALALAGLKLDDIGVIELNEAFAAQALAVIRVAGLDPEKVNPNGGAIALGHPLGCTGAKLTATILREMERRRRAIRHGHDVRRRRPGRGRESSKEYELWQRHSIIQTRRRLPDRRSAARRNLHAGRSHRGTPRHRAQRRANSSIRKCAPTWKRSSTAISISPFDCCAKPRRSGLESILTPEHYGGMELDLDLHDGRGRTVSRATVPSPAGTARTRASARCPCCYFGTEAQKQKYLPKLSNCEWWAPIALPNRTPAPTRWPPRPARTCRRTARHYILNGQKMWITNGGKADLFTVFAKIGGEKFSAFLVERVFPGVSMARKKRRWALRAVPPRRSSSITSPCLSRTCWAKPAAATSSR